MVELVVADTGSKLQVTCSDNDTLSVINLTGATVTLRWVDANGVLQTKTMTVTNAVGGVAEYLFLAGEIAYPKMKFEVIITDSGGKTITNLELIEVATRNRLS